MKSPVCSAFPLNAHLPFILCRSLLLTGILWMGIVTSSLAQTIEWQKTFGGLDAEVAKVSIETADGGYLVAGTSGSNDGQVTGNHGQYDAWLVKINRSGNLVWQKSYGGYNVDFVSAITETSDGGYLLAGSTTSNDGDLRENHGRSDVWVINIDNAGNLLWQKVLGGTGDDQTFAIKRVPEGGYILAASTTSNDGQVRGYHGNLDAWLVKLNTDGELLWQKTLGGTGDDYFKSIALSVDGGYTLAGITSSSDGDLSGSHGNTDAWVVNINGAGKLVWQKTYGGSEFDGFNAIIPQPDDSYLLTGHTWSTDGDVSGNHGKADVWLVKLNKSGELIRQKTFGGTSAEYGVSVLTTVDGGLIIAADANSNDGDVSGNHNSSDFWVVKLDYAWNLTWQKSLGGFYDEYISSIILPKEGGYLGVGHTYSNNGDVTGSHGFSEFWVVKLQEGIRLLPPSYDCGSGRITFNTIGGDGSSINYNAPGIIRSSATSNTGIVEQELRSDPKPIPITATQKGITITYTFDLGTYCAGTPPSGGPLTLSQPAYNCQTGVIDFKVSGGDGSPIVYTAPGIIRSATTDRSGTVEPELRSDPKPLSIQATQQGQTTAFIFDFGAYCSGLNPTLTLLAPGYDCATGAIRFTTGGGDGTPIEFMAVGITAWTTRPDQFLDAGLRSASDVQPFTLLARQSGRVVSYSWNLKAACGRSRVGTAEQLPALSVLVLGNPVTDAFMVDIGGVEGQLLDLRLVDGQGRLVESRSVGKAGTTERQRFDLPQLGPGLLFLRISSETQHKTVKVLKL